MIVGAATGEAASQEQVLAEQGYVVLAAVGSRRFSSSHLAGEDRGGGDGRKAGDKSSNAPPTKTTTPPTLTRAYAPRFAPRKGGGNLGPSIDIFEATMAFDAAVAASNSGSIRLSPGHPLVTWLLDEPFVADLITAVLGREAKAVRAIAFDKTSGANWSVPWHQDRTIAVDRCDERAAVTNWTVKAGVDHCEPSAAFLSRMLTLRWHLDPVDEGDGCLRVLPGSHRQGRLTQPAIRSRLQSIKPLDVIADPGTLLAMRPLLVHSSSRRRTNGHRRTLHVELAVGEPPTPLRWAA